MKRALSFLVWIRRALEVSLILGVVIVILHSQKPVVSTASAALLDEGPMPDLGGAVGWLNSAIPALRIPAEQVVNHRHE